MPVLVYTESENGKIKKTGLEAVSFARAIADKMGTQVTAVCVNAQDAETLGKYGASKVLEVQNEKLEKFNGEAYADLLAQAAAKENAKVLVLTSSPDSKYMAPSLAIELEAGYVPNIVSVPESTDPFKVKHQVFS